MSQLEQSGTTIGFVILIACIVMAVFIFPGLIDTDTQSVETESQLVELEKGESTDLVSSNYSVTLLSVNTSTSEATYELTNGNESIFSATIDKNRTLMFSDKNITVRLSEINKTIKEGGTFVYNPFVNNSSMDNTSDAVLLGDTAENTPIESQVKIRPKTSGYITNLTFYYDITLGSWQNMGVNVYLREGNPNGSYRTGNLVRKNYTLQSFSGTQKTIDINETYVESGKNYTVTFETRTSNNDSFTDIIYVNVDESPQSKWYWSSYNGEYNAYADIDFVIQEASEGETKATSTFYIQNFIENEKANSLWQIVLTLFVATVFFILIVIGIPKSDTL